MKDYEEGCFIYIVAVDTIRARNKPSCSARDRTRLELEGGEMVCVDMILHKEEKKEDDGPFLRLADHSGWLYERCSGRECLRRVPCEKSLWSFYVDNIPEGQFLRRHPILADDMNIEDMPPLYPMQKIYCDAKVTHPKTALDFYRVQGTNGWVFDFRDDDKATLIPCEKVTFGVFCYRALADMAIRSTTSVADSSMTGRAVKKGELVAADVLRFSPSGDTGNGPFLRLVDGLGWLFVRKERTKVMEEVPVQFGAWEFKVLNKPVGVGLRRHPMDRQNLLLDATVIPYKELILCDCKVEASNGVNFYKLEGTNGWVFDRRGKTDMLELVSEDKSALPDKNTERNRRGWTQDFVRGIAATVGGLKEIGRFRHSQVLCFRSAAGVRINVYCKTRTVTTRMESMDQVCHYNCSPPELTRIFSRDLLETTLDAYSDNEEKKLADGHDPQNDDEVEVSVRKCILDYDQELLEIQKKRAEAFKVIEEYDDKRAGEAAQVQKMFEKCQEEDVVSTENNSSKHDRLSQKSGRRSSSFTPDPSFDSGRSSMSSWIHIKSTRTCGECGAVFGTVQERDDHCRNKHGLYCERCDRVFKSFGALDEHRDLEDHW